MSHLRIEIHQGFGGSCISCVGQDKSFSVRDIDILRHQYCQLVTVDILIARRHEIRGWWKLGIVFGWSWELGAALTTLRITNVASVIALCEGNVAVLESC